MNIGIATLQNLCTCVNFFNGVVLITVNLMSMYN